MKKTENGMATAALVDEARKRGLTYGKLVQNTTKEEREDIIARFIRARKRAEKKKDVSS